ncbi:CaiB/BaiF CoA transferase family protein [Sphingorhabdus arenilitoris]|uniref:CaiB/BaiF CoA transferase family protein n=1 Tax=Sphingorhabdus arenilitoris TaxID=1490041 RepID=A0ABV8RHN3_9SPHN
MGQGKLSGVKVVDLTLFLPGPMLTMMMADQGAEVVKVEPPGGDPARNMEPFEASHSVWFTNANRGKKSIVCDLKTDAGKSALWELIEGADVFVEGFRPGVMQRLGFDYAAVAARNPAIIYCSLTAFGQHGALADHPAHDMAVQALSGFLSVNDGQDGVPVVPGVASADMAGGLTALSAILMALIGRASSGRGDYIDIAMFDAILPWCVHTASSAIVGGDSPRSHEQRSLGGAAFYQVYETADNRHIVLGAREEKFVRNLLGALGHADRVEEALRPAGQQGDLIELLRSIFAQKTQGDWTHWFADKDVAFAPVLNFREAFDSAHLQDRALIVEAKGRHHIAPAIRYASEDAWLPGKVPDLGA